MNYTYTDVEAAMEAVEVAVKDTIGDNPDLTEDVIYWDMVQSIMHDCDPATTKELGRITGVSIPRLTWSDFERIGLVHDE